VSGTVSRAAPAESAASPRSRSISPVVLHGHAAERGLQEQERRALRVGCLGPGGLLAQQHLRLGRAPDAQVDLRPQRGQLVGHRGDVGALGHGEHALGLLEPHEALVGKPGRLQVAGGLDEPAGALDRVG
jgi:hypothetical protein